MRTAPSVDNKLQLDSIRKITKCKMITSIKKKTLPVWGTGRVASYTYWWYY